jgi:hypothetical protein
VQHDICVEAGILDGLGVLKVRMGLLVSVVKTLTPAPVLLYCLREAGFGVNDTQLASIQRITHGCTTSSPGRLNKLIRQPFVVPAGFSVSDVKPLIAADVEPSGAVTASVKSPAGVTYTELQAVTGSHPPTLLAGVTSPLFARRHCLASARSQGHFRRG